jgi:hypothetical protein
MTTGPQLAITRPRVQAQLTHECKMNELADSCRLSRLSWFSTLEYVSRWPPGHIPATLANADSSSLKRAI